MPEGNLIVRNKYKVFTRDKYVVTSFFLSPFIRNPLTETAGVAHRRFNIIYLAYHVTAHAGIGPLPVPWLVYCHIQSHWTGFEVNIFIL